jgi:hypothetical protein
MTAIAPQKTSPPPHSVSSDIGKNPKLFKRKVSTKSLDYGKYLIGRSYKQFETSIRVEKTRVMYRIRLYHFCEHLGMTTEQIVEKWGPRSKGGKIKAVDLLNLQDKIEDYIMLLRGRMDKGELSPATVKTAFPPIKLFLEMNDVVLNFRKIGRLLPSTDSNAKDSAYTRPLIQKMLGLADLRAKIPILWMSSSGSRLGGFVPLVDGDATPIFDKGGEIVEMRTDEAEKSGAFEKHKLLAAHVVFYRREPEEYDGFVSPEAFTTYLQYRRLRQKAGEGISPKSPILIRRFDYSPYSKEKTVIDSEPAGYSTVVGLLSNISYKAGIRKPSEDNERRYDTKVSHGFRKYFKTTISAIRTKDGRSAIEPVRQEWLYGHALSGLLSSSENYDRNNRVRMLLEEYLKGVGELTITDEERLKVKVIKLQEDISNIKTVSVELEQEKQRSRSLEERMQKRLEEQDRQHKQDMEELKRKIQSMES